MKQDYLDFDERGEGSDPMEEIGKTLLEHISSDVRINALSLLTRAGPGKPAIGSVYTCLRARLPCFHRESDPKARNEFIAIMKAFIFRVCVAIRHLSRDSQGSLASDDDNQIRFPSHIEFLLWYLDYLHTELRANASYQSHITALRILHNVQNLVQDPFTLMPAFIEAAAAYMGLYRKMWRSLFDLLLDPFDDVRQAVSSILNQMLKLILLQKSSIYRDEFLSIARTTFSIARAKASKVGRAYQSDGVGRLHCFLYACSARLVGRQECANMMNELFARFKMDVDGLKIGSSLGLSSSLHGYAIALR